MLAETVFTETVFSVNGRTVGVRHPRDATLLEVLRDQLGLTGAKDGCGEGQCGTCTVLLDGRAVRACVVSMDRVAGRRVTTVEGLDARDRECFARAFSETGAVQCGFCIPGMVMAALALLARRPNPTRSEIASALQGNVCRCTGYVKIFDAVERAAALRRGEDPGPYRLCPRQAAGGATDPVGAGWPRPDARDKILGVTRYAGDMTAPGMLYGAVLRSRYPRARIRAIDTSKALRLPGVRAVLTAADIPGRRLHGLIVHDWPALVAVGEQTRYVGDALALVAADSARAARQAVERIEVDYEVLPPLTSPEQALAEGAPQLHPHAPGNLLAEHRIERGDAEAALRRSAHVVTHTYTTPFVEHAFLEPEAALAVPTDEGLVVYASDQSVFHTREAIAAMLGLPESRVRVISQAIGGAFGGKEDMNCQHHAALLAWHTRRPVRITLSRAESLRVHPKRHAFQITMSTGCDEHGRLTALWADIVGDTGAYASVGSAVLQRACVHATGPYEFPHVKIRARAVYTNNIPAGAFRGFGVNQVAFAIETQLDLLAERVGISPWEIRWINALDEGRVFSTGQRMGPGTAFRQTLLAVRDAYERHPRAGLACAIKNVGIGCGLPDAGRVRLAVEAGRVVVYCGAICMGQGLEGALLQVTAQALDLPPDRIRVVLGDTGVCPDSGVTTASRMTVFGGEAVRQAAEKLRADARALGKALPQALADLEGRSYVGEYLPTTDPLDSPRPDPTTHVAYGFASQVVCLDEKGRVERVVAAVDVGRAINPLALEGQLEGGIAMGLGYALTEAFEMEGGYPVSTAFHSLGLWRAKQMPDIEVILVESEAPGPAFGAKGVGEIATIPTAPATAAAYRKLDGRLRLSLPLEQTWYRPGRREAARAAAARA